MFPLHTEAVACKALESSRLRTCKSLLTNGIEPNLQQFYRLFAGQSVQILTGVIVLLAHQSLYTTRVEKPSLYR